MKKISLFLMLVMFGFGMMGVQTAEGAAPIIKAPCEGHKFAGSSDGGNCATGPGWNARMAIAPYAQVVAGDSYTFIGISHPSLATAHTSIGVVVEALGMTTVPDTASGRAAVFTVSAGETHRVFVINQGHATINAANSAFTDSQTHLITTPDTAQFGSIKVWAIGTEPNMASLNTGTTRPGDYSGDVGGASADGDTIYRFDNLAQLSMWGVVYRTANGAGFAMEFIGDMHDSSAMGSSAYPAIGIFPTASNTSGVGRGIN